MNDTNQKGQAADAKKPRPPVWTKQERKQGHGSSFSLLKPFAKSDFPNLAGK